MSTIRKRAQRPQAVLRSGRRTSNPAMADYGLPSGDGLNVSSKKNQLLRRLFTAVPVSCTVILLLCTWQITRDAKQSRERYQQTAQNLLLTTQQLGDVFQQQWNELSAEDQQLDDDDRKLLTTWLVYDAKYLQQNSNNSDVCYERAMAHCRMGHAEYILGNVAHSTDHFRTAIDLLAELSDKNPTVSSYVADQADIHTRLAWTYDSIGEEALFASSFHAAVEIADSAPLPGEPDFSLQCATTFSNLAKLAHKRNEEMTAQSLMARALELHALLHDNSENPPMLSPVRLREGPTMDRSNTHMDTVSPTTRSTHRRGS